ncbi:MAG: ABC transporter ATP-binding protein/permease [Hyphomicrobiales bacterium]|nr:ABC transporter ATP-binding protein/permease [Hyphomicrobiales bacterium]
MSTTEMGPAPHPGDSVRQAKARGIHEGALPSGGPPQPPADQPGPHERSAARDAWLLAAALMESKFRNGILLLGAAILVVLVATMVGQVELNKWEGRLFDAIGAKNLDGVIRQLWFFAGLIAVLLTLVVSQTWLHEMIKLRLREWLTHRLLDNWLVSGRVYRLGMSADVGANPDQRMQQDTQNLTELTADLGIGLVHHVFLLLTFIGILWGLSSQVVFNIGGRQLYIPGYMVWCAIGYALAGSLLTYFVGRRLIGLNATRYAREAELRFAMVRVSERAEAIALYRGEADERKIINSTFNHVLEAVRNLVFALARLTWITSGYGWVAIVVPVLVALPGYLNGSLSLGGLMMVVGAFRQVQQALKWFVDHFPKIAEWRAALYRVVLFDEALMTLSNIEDDTEQIELLAHPEGKLAFEHVSVLLADGQVVIAEATATVELGERVLIVGESGTGKSTLFRAIAGIWPWGGGKIYLPPRDQMMFLPQYPYLPLGTLRGAAAYPQGPDAFSEAEIVAAMEKVGLAEFRDMLDVEERWDRILSLGQQQRLAFVRLLLHKPLWVFLDEATGALDEANQTRVMTLVNEELSESTIVSIGHRPSLAAFHNRTLNLVPTPSGARLRRRQHPTVTAGWLQSVLGKMWKPRRPTPGDRI